MVKTKVVKKNPRGEWGSVFALYLQDNGDTVLFAPTGSTVLYLGAHMCQELEKWLHEFNSKPEADLNEEDY